MFPEPGFQALMCCPPFLKCLDIDMMRVSRLRQTSVRRVEHIFVGSEGGQFL